jgi:hypothetical protein
MGKGATKLRVLLMEDDPPILRDSVSIPCLTSLFAAKEATLAAEAK